MTVPWQNVLPRRFSSLGWFWRISCRWHGGVYKLLVWDLLVFLAIWYCIWLRLTVVVEEDELEHELKKHPFKHGGDSHKVRTCI